VSSLVATHDHTPALDAYPENRRLDDTQKTEAKKFIDLGIVCCCNIVARHIIVAIAAYVVWMHERPGFSFHIVVDAHLFRPHRICIAYRILQMRPIATDVWRGLSVCLSETFRYPANTAGPLEMLFFGHEGRDNYRAPSPEKFLNFIPKKTTF